MYFVGVDLARRRVTGPTGGKPDAEQDRGDGYPDDGGEIGEGGGLARLEVTEPECQSRKASAEATPPR